MIISEVAVEKEFKASGWLSSPRKYSVVYQIEHSERLGYRAKGQEVGCLGGIQISPKWRKSQKTAENDLARWRKDE